MTRKKKKLWAIFLAVCCGFLLYFFLFKSLLKKSTAYQVLCVGEFFTCPLESHFENCDIHARVHLLSNPSWRSGEYLNHLKSSDILKKISPDVVIIMLDPEELLKQNPEISVTQFSENVREIIQILKNHVNPDHSNPIVFNSTLPLVTNSALKPDQIQRKNEIERALVSEFINISKEENIYLINLYESLKKRPDLLSEIHIDQRSIFIAGLIFKKVFPFIKGIPAEENEKLPAIFKGKIVFQSDRSGNEDIFVVDHGGVKAITTSPATDGYPVFSPDGKAIAFESNRSGKFELYMSDLKGNTKKLLDSPTEDRSPFWSYDGKYLLFGRRIHGRVQIFRYNFQTQNLEQITKFTRGKNGLVSLSPDGRYLLLTSNRFMGWHVYKIDLLNNEEIKLTKGYGGCRAKYSHSGRWISLVSHKFDGKGDVFITEAETINLQRLTTDSEFHDYFPAFSPDDRYIVYASSPELKSGNYDIKIIEISTRKIWNITSSPAKDMLPFWGIE